MRADGKFTGYLGRISYNRDDPPSGVEPTDSIPVPFVLWDVNGAVTDTIGWAGNPPPRMWRPPGQYDTSIDFVQVGDQRLPVPRPPVLMPFWEPLQDGYLLVDTPLPENAEVGSLTVTRIGLHGDTVYHQTLRYEPVRYSEADLDSIAARGARGEAGGMLPVYIPGTPTPPNWEEIARAFRGAMDFPDFQTPLESVWVAQDESVWLRRRGTGPSARWILLDPGGRPRGQIEMPGDVRVRWQRGDTFWAADPDELEVPWLVRFEIRPGRGSAS